MNLACCTVGEQARILDVEVEPGLRLRLRELGLRPGALVEITHDAGRQGRVLAVGAERFALDARTCTLVAVERVERGEPAARIARADRVVPVERVEPVEAGGPRDPGALVGTAPR
jgi:ferrous iron transport protein A